MGTKLARWQLLSAPRLTVTKLNNEMVKSNGIAGPRNELVHESGVHE